jgi:hypothetical protein
VWSVGLTTGLLCARLLLAGVFALASITKLGDLRGSRAAVAGFGVPERFASTLGTLVPLRARARRPAGSEWSCPKQGEHRPRGHRR